MADLVIEPDAHALEGQAVVAACRRAETLLHRLEAQFLSDVVAPDGRPAF
jgi:hypothetical protein